MRSVSGSRGGEGTSRGVGGGDWAAVVNTYCAKVVSDELARIFWYASAGASAFRELDLLTGYDSARTYFDAIQRSLCEIELAINDASRIGPVIIEIESPKTRWEPLP